jgi:hypothetical protein
MSSEAIVVLILTAIAVGFIIWVRMNSRAHDQTPDNVREKGESSNKSQ